MNIDKIEIIKSKADNLWYKVNLKLTPIERDFRNRINAFFSQQQKEIISNINKNEEELLDFEKYLDKFINIYVDNVVKIFNIVKKRVEGESQTELTEDLINPIRNTYTLKYIPKVADLVMNTTVKHINSLNNEYKQEKITKDEFKQKVNEYFDKECKKKRSKLIAKTEVYRLFNFAYLNLMGGLGYYYKIYIAKPNTSCDICSKLHLQRKLIIEPFDISVLHEKDKLLISNSLFPPLHPQSTSILLCIKGE